MKIIDITRPDKLLMTGIKSLGSLSFGYTAEKRQAKGLAEFKLIGEKKTDEIKTQLYKYNETEVSCQNDLEDLSFFKLFDPAYVNWFNMHGLHDVELVQKVGNENKLDRLTIRQILDTTLRPKVEEFEHFLFFSVKSIIKGDSNDIKLEQLSFVLTEHSVLSFQEEDGDHFDYIRNKLDNNLGLMRKKTADYLVCQQLDAILDNYFETIDSLNEEVNTIQAEILKNPSQNALLKLEGLKQVSEMIKKALTPFKEALRIITTSESRFIKPENTKYYNDLVNSCMAATEDIGSTLSTIESLTNIYFSSLSQKMNETMTVLSLVATIFIPLTFIAGIYGMNFENMPELRNPNGYFYALGGMVIVGISMVVYFRFKRWL